MSTLGIILLVIFAIVSLLLILLVSIQDDGENGMGGLLGGRGTAAFGSHSASVLTKTTFIFVVLFFALTLGLALVNKAPKLEKDLLPAETVETTENAETTTESNWWESETAPEAEAAVETETAQEDAE